MKITSFNLKHDLIPLGRNTWKHRADAAAKLIRGIDPDLLGTQELTLRNLAGLHDRLPGYAWTGEGRKGGASGETNAVFYKTDRFFLLKSRTFWLSGHPDLAGSRGWFSLYPRICTALRLREKQTGKELLFYNTHLDHISFYARRKSLELIRSEIVTDFEKDGPCPVIVSGDFNAPLHSRALRAFESDVPGYERLLVSSFRLFSRPGYSFGRTYHGFSDSVRPGGHPIDHIFTSRDLVLRNLSLCRDQVDLRYPSDHFPITAELFWGPSPLRAL